MELVQNKSPKVDAKTLAPASFPSDPDLEWCAARAGGRVAHWAHACPGLKRVFARYRSAGLPGDTRSPANPASVWRCSLSACGAAQGYMGVPASPAPPLDAWLSPELSWVSLHDGDAVSDWEGPHWL